MFPSVFFNYSCITIKVLLQRKNNYENNLVFVRESLMIIKTFFSKKKGKTTRKNAIKNDS